MLWYLAAAVRPQAGETIEGNLSRAITYQRALLKSGIHVIAPYVGLCHALNDADPQERSLGMAVDLEVLARCDGLVLVGPRLSSGMERERELALRGKLKVVDALQLDAAAVVEAVNVVECLWEFSEGTTEVIPPE